MQVIYCVYYLTQKMYFMYKKSMKKPGTCRTGLFLGTNCCLGYSALSVVADVVCADVIMISVTVSPVMVTESTLPTLISERAAFVVVPALSIMTEVLSETVISFVLPVSVRPPEEATLLCVLSTAGACPLPCGAVPTAPPDVCPSGRAGGVPPLPPGGTVSGTVRRRGWLRIGTGR